MIESLKNNRVAWLAAGVLLGLGAGGWLPHAPLHATATDRQDNFSIATGHLDDEVEAVFFLDFLTGNLKAAAISGISGKFNALYEVNILNVLGVDVTKNPKYLMVTGLAQLRRSGGGVQPGASVVYVAEVTSGKVAAFGVPWSRAAANSNQPIKAALIPLDVVQFRTAAVRDE